MLHICFGDSEYGSIKHAMKLGLIKKEDIILFNDDLSVGDISSCREYESRKDTIHNIYDNDIVHIDDNEIKNELDDFYGSLLKESDFVIWYAHNPSDYCDLYYVVSLIQSKNIKVVECIKKTVGDITLYYKCVGEALPEEMAMLLNQARELSGQEKDEYRKKWELLEFEKGLLRAEVSGEIKTVNENYYDNIILRKVPKNSQLIIHVVGELIGLDKPCLRDWFFIWRIKYLAEIGSVEIDYKCDRYILNCIRTLV